MSHTRGDAGKASLLWETKEINKREKAEYFEQFLFLTHVTINLERDRLTDLGEHHWEGLRHRRKNEDMEDHTLTIQEGAGGWENKAVRSTDFERVRKGALHESLNRNLELVRGERKCSFLLKRHLSSRLNPSRGSPWRWPVDTGITKVIQRI